MKINTPIVTAIFFIALSIWLSFSVKKANEALFDAQTQLKTTEQELNISKYQADILLEALELNIGKAPVPTRLTSTARTPRPTTSSPPTSKSSEPNSPDEQC